MLVEKIKLLPCPFCGSHNVGIFFKVDKRNIRYEAGIKKTKVLYYASCKDCHSKGGCSVKYVSLCEHDREADRGQDMAAVIWNQRKPLEDIVRELDALEDEASAEYRRAKLGQTKREMDYYDGLEEAYRTSKYLVRGGAEYVIIKEVIK